MISVSASQNPVLALTAAAAVNPRTGKEMIHSLEFSESIRPLQLASHFIYLESGPMGRFGSYSLSDVIRGDGQFEAN